MFKVGWSSREILRGFARKHILFRKLSIFMTINTLQKFQIQTPNTPNYRHKHQNLDHHKQTHNK